MYVTLRNDEGILIESTRHKIKIDADGFGKLRTKLNDKSTLVAEDELFEKQLKDMVKKAEDSGWEKGRHDPMQKFLKEFVERASAACQVDKNKLFFLMRENCNYSSINYFQSARFYNFKTSDELKIEANNLRQEIRDLKKEHGEEVVRLQKEITEIQRIEVGKVEVEGSCYMDYNLNVNCPHCNAYQNVKDVDDWHPGESLEVNQECESCDKVFSVNHDGSI